MNRAPPESTASASAGTVQPARAATSASRMALRGENVRQPQRDSSSLLILAGAETLHEVRAQPSSQKIRVAENFEMERDRGLDAFDDGHLEAAFHPDDRFLTIPAV